MQRKSDIFCQHYEKWKAIDYIIFENPAAYALWNITPAVPGQALVIPKLHVEDIRELHGKDLQGFIHAIPETFEAIQQIYQQEPEYLYSFYSTIISKSPTFFEEYEHDFRAKIQPTLEMILRHQDLMIEPTAYNLGMNCGYNAGQRIAHIHLHLFPRRKPGLGVVTAMRKHLR